MWVQALICFFNEKWLQEKKQADRIQQLRAQIEQLKFDADKAESYAADVLSGNFDNLPEEA